MTPNNIPALRMVFCAGSGERAESNAVLKLCDELEMSRKSNAELGRDNLLLLTENAQLRSQLADTIKP